MSFGIPGRLSAEDRFPPSPLYDRHLDIDPPSSRLSMASDGFDLLLSTPHRRSHESFGFSALSRESARSSWSSQATTVSPQIHTLYLPIIRSMAGLNACTLMGRLQELEDEMRRLRQELKQTMDMYSTARKEALSAKQTVKELKNMLREKKLKLASRRRRPNENLPGRLQARELRRWKKEEARRLENARAAGEAALVMVEKEKAKSKAAAEAAETARRMAEMEARRRRRAEMAACKEAEERSKALVALAKSDTRYRRYSIEEIEAATDFFAENLKIGEGGYGPVFRGSLDHTPVAIKILRPNADQGRSQFQQEVI